MINFSAIGLAPLPFGDLDSNFTADEVWNAIKELSADRASGPNGFTGQFYKSAWHIIGDGIMASIQ